MRLSGKEIFMQKGVNALDFELTLDSEADGDNEAVDELDDLVKEEEKITEGALYDKNLFAEEIGEDDDIDFD